MSAPPLTIGLPVYNGERFLAKALDSILRQTFADFTLVVGDNASTDGTREIVEERRAADERVVVLPSDVNRGAAWNYNRVLAECKSPLFKWAAADDMLAPTYVERLLAALEDAPPSVVLAYPGTQLIDANDEVVRPHSENLAAPEGTPPHARLRKVIRNVVFGNVIFSIMRVDALRKTRLHGNFPSADQVVLSELALVGDFREVDEPLFLRRLHDESSTVANTTAESLAHWFEPGRRPVHRETFNLFREHLAGIRHADLPSQERALAYAAFLTAWTRRLLRPRTRVRRALGRLPR